MEPVLVIFMVIGALWGISSSHRENRYDARYGSLSSRFSAWMWILFSGTIIGVICALMAYFVIFGVLGLLLQGLAFYG